MIKVKLNAKVASVHRSSGGWILAEPFEIVRREDLNTIEHKNRSQSPKSRRNIRVKVRFKDLKFLPTGELAFSEPIVYVKSVSRRQLSKAFSFTLDGSSRQPFVMDFGNGIVPIQVIGYEATDGITWAYFVEPEDFKNLSQYEDQKQCRIRIYRVDREVIRYVATNTVFGGPSEYEAAENNYRILRAGGRLIIPNELAVGPSLVLPTMKGEREAHQYLSLLIDNKLRPSKNEEMENTQPTVCLLEEKLVPFGDFE